jgi:DNA repair exonuclease SbcCD ATPase subunit
MKHIYYKTLRGQNFLSIGNDQISIDFQSGFNLITGKNIDNPDRVNGIGKSSIAELFYYALFGKTIREIKKEFIINNVTKGKGAIELTFDVKTENDVQTYTIKRQVKPSSVTLLQGDVDITKDSIANTDKFICDLIGSNSIISRSCDMLSLSDNIPFMAKKPEEKRKFINDIFSLEIFGKMSNELKNLIRENKSDISISNAKLEEMNNTLDTLNAQQADYETKIAEREKILEQRRADITNKIENVQKSIESIEILDVSEVSAELEKYHEAWRKLDGKIGQVGNNIAAKETLRRLKANDVKSVSTVDTTVKCDKCLQDIPHTHVEHLEKLKTQYTQELVEIEQEIEQSKTEKQQYLTKKERIQVKVAELQDQIDTSKLNRQKLESFQIQIEQYQESLNNLKLEELPKPNFEDNINNTEKRKEVESENLNLLKQKSQDFEVCKFVLSEEGVRSFVVKRLLSMMNASIQQYINDLGMSIRCKFDEYFDEKLSNDKGVEISYWNLSGGERRTVDLACAWAFKDLKRKISGVSSNVEFFDEYLDSTLDSTGIDKLIEQIKCRIDKYNLSVYVISHRVETNKHVTGEVVELFKENGVTRRIS